MKKQKSEETKIQQKKNITLLGKKRKQASLVVT